MKHVIYKWYVHFFCSVLIFSTLESGQAQQDKTIPLSATEAPPTYQAADLISQAEMHRTQGRYAEAELLYQKAVKIAEGVFGPKHPNLALALNNLAEVYRAPGQVPQSRAALSAGLYNQ